LNFSRPGATPIISITSKWLKGKDIREIKIPYAQKEFIQVSVCDNGIGFAQEHAEIFLNLLPG
jgi:signal transduction histidine kinase